MAASIQKRARLVDVLWEVTGDTAVDASWYAKRGLVAAVYGATEVYMLTDFSPGKHRICAYGMTSSSFSSSFLLFLELLCMVELIWKQVQGPRCTLLKIKA